VKLDPDKLAFDRFERARRACEVIEFFDPNGRARVLDVGGYPGLLADALPGREVWTLDQPPCARPRYVQGSAGDPPFKNQEFDIVVASDVLEHIPSAQRPGVVAQMARVAARVVIVSGPFDTPGVMWVDRKIAEWTERLTGEPHAWLREHVEHGAPSLTNTVRRLRAAGAEAIAVHPDGDLLRWFLLQFGGLAAAALPGAQSAAEALSRASNRHLAARDSDGAAYRHIIVAPKVLDDDSRPLPWPMIDPADPRDAGIQAALEALSEGLEIIVNALESLSARSAGGMPPEAMGYIRTLEMALEENARLTPVPMPLTGAGWRSRLRRRWRKVSDERENPQGNGE